MPRKQVDARPVAEHSLAWLWEPMTGDRGFALKSMFGAKVGYLDDVLRLAFTAGQEPWDGLLVCTEREHHASLRAEFPELRPHTILPKWLYLSAGEGTFEETGKAIVRACLRRDVRIGIVNTKKKRSDGGVGKTRKRPEGPGREVSSGPGELRNVVNLGDVSAGWLEEAGITRFAELKRLGAIECCRRVAATGRAVSAMLAYAIEGAVQGVRWEELPREVRAELRAAVARMGRATE